MADPTSNSRNPANSDSLAGAFREIMGKFLAGVDDMLPAVVLEYDRETNRATVRPLVQILKTDNTLETRAEIASVPVLNIGGGNAVLSFNILPGDLGWIKANDRDISLFLQNETGADVAPATLRKHEFSDSVFIPDQFRKWTLDEADSEAVVLQTLDSLSRISIGPEGVRITSDNIVVIEAPNTVIIGNVLNFGNWTTFGSIVGTVAITSVGVVLATHVHTGVTTGGSNTGGPA